MGSAVLQITNKPQPGHESTEREHVSWLVARLYLSWAAHRGWSWCQPMAVVTLERPSLPVKQHSWLGQGGFASQGAPHAACAAQKSTGWFVPCLPGESCTLTTIPCTSSGQEWQHRQILLGQTPSELHTHPHPEWAQGWCAQNTSSAHQILNNNGQLTGSLPVTT